MSEIRAKFPIATVNRNKIDEHEFTCQLAEWANKYVDGIAVPVMAAASELYQDDAVVLLVSKWYDAHCAYKKARLRYFADVAAYANDPERAFEPHLYRSWEKDNEDLYDRALSALLIR